MIDLAPLKKLCEKRGWTPSEHVAARRALPTLIEEIERRIAAEGAWKETAEAFEALDDMSEPDWTVTCNAKGRSADIYKAAQEKAYSALLRARAIEKEETQGEE